MKKLILAVFVVVLTGCFPHIDPGNIAPVKDASYQRIIEVPGKTKDQLFEKSRQWFATTFVSSKKVIEYENSSEGKIIGNGSGNVSLNYGSISPIIYKVNYLITEDIKDGKIRITFDKIRLSNMYGNDIGDIYVDGWKQLQPKLVFLSESLESFINKPATGATW